jgi:hypothetical protein
VNGKIGSGDYTVYYSAGKCAERGLAIVVYKIVVRIVFKKIVYDRIIANKLDAKPINILMIQVYMLTSEHEDDGVEELYCVIEEILEGDGKGKQSPL